MIRLLLCLLLLPWRAFAADPIIVRASVEPESGIWIGQQVKLRMDVLGLDGWARFRRPPELEVAGAWLMRVETQGTRLSESIAGEQYSGQRYEWLLFPQRGGEISVPSSPVEVELKNFGTEAEEQRYPLQTPPATFEVAVPEGAGNIPGLISTTRLTAVQTWEPRTSKLSTGDGIKRSITFKAADVSGMAFTPLEYAPIDGIAVYPGEPEVADQVNRGMLESGQRIETVTYVPAHQGSFQLPDIRVSWWDIGDRILRHETLKGVTLKVVAGKGDAATAFTSRRSSWWLFATLAIAGTMVLVSSRRGELVSRWRQRRAMQRESEPAWFQRFTQAARHGKTNATMAALMGWLDRLDLEPAPTRLENFMDIFGDQPARQQARKLVLAFANQPGGDWKPAELNRGVASARKNFLKQRGRTRAGTAAGLVPLNPPRSHAAVLRRSVSFAVRSGGLSENG